MIQGAIQATQLNKKPLERLSNLAGSGTLTSSIHPVNGKVIWHWQLTSRDYVRKFLVNIIPHLCTKKLQATLLLEAMCDQGPRGHRGYTDDRWKNFFAVKKNIERLNKKYV